jgi:uncharacterized membrane protein YdjX (TVP38/TMEM64 family)
MGEEVGSAEYYFRHTPNRGGQRETSGIYSQDLAGTAFETVAVEEIPAAPPSKGCGYYTKFVLQWTWDYIKSITWKGWVKIGIFILFLIAIGLLLLFLPWESWLGDFLSWIEALGVWGPILLAELYVICTVCFVPGSILTIGAGFAFQSVWVGTVAVSIGSTLGCFCAFLFGNTLLRRWVEKQIAPYAIFTSIDKAITHKGWLVVLLLRLSPLVPFNLLNYALGLTDIGLIPYFLCSWIGMLPATVVYVYIGTTVTDIALIVAGQLEPSALTITLFAVGLLATILVVILISYIAKVQIQKVIAEAEKLNPTPKIDHKELNRSKDLKDCTQ